MHTLAILYPGYSAEDEFPALEQIIPETSFPVIHTWESSTDHDVEALLDLGSRGNLVPSAEKARELAPRAAMWACTSGSFVYGLDGCREQARWIQEAAGVPSSSTSLAFAEAVHHLGLNRVAVAATYPQDVASHFVRFLEEDGITVTALSTYDVPSGEDAGLLDAEWVLETARAADLTGAQCLLIPDTALHTIAVLPRLEEALGVPVLTANQVTAWQGLRLAGHPARAEGLGALFRR
ncbi:maleate cis-trans isomerase family protein [Nesterenkonia halotolerans]|uniref:Maleate cis-trans isomerase n=1 Tax=Nesterenkonia halotolerans TaxID=225325 RepID=A0ABR9J4I3_9MICC|nr:maleate cis-trans isomerase [Nesterenkonia halotolerans]MBE1513879.1 maleate cis-trans isomerase [Nesterenkonia halotolerans]